MHARKDAGRLGTRILREAGVEMTIHYPVVLERAESGAVSACVRPAGLRGTHAKAERVIRGVLRAYLDAHPGTRSDARVRVAHVAAWRAGKIDIVGVAALVGARQSAAKARASRRKRPARWAAEEGGARRTKAVR